jgi:thiol-disulfide isomerase/thioredoxin
MLRPIAARGRSRARLQRLVCAGLLAGLLGCDEGKSPPAAPPSRVEAIAAKVDDDKPTDLCDVVPAASAAPRFAWPPLAGPVPAAASGYRWINVWATWCPPCIEELPLLRKLQAEFGSSGSAISLHLLSVDAEASAVSAFEVDHPEVGGTLRIADLAQLEPWLASIGLDKGATLPVHVFVDPAGKVLCSRTGALRESDAPRLRRLLHAR